MISRYQTELMKELWSDENKFKTWYLVEIAHLRARLANLGQEKNDLIKRLEKKKETIDWAHFSQEVFRYDREIRHDVIAFLHALEDELGDDARLLHLGLTSSDIVDTSFALLLRASLEEILKKLRLLIDTLWQQAQKYRGVMCLGRTHGQAAEPTTFGIKLLSHLAEFERSFKRLLAIKKDIAVGKLSGAVGVYSHTDPLVEKNALFALGLNPETVATQTIARDRHAAFFSALAVLAGSIERLAVEIRLLMHGQVAEVFEPFYEKQKGSSAMPHKKNPVLSENLTGLMRLMRSYAQAALENQALWHERDISHSAVERVIAPDALSVMDFALDRAVQVAKDLVVDQEKMAHNLDDVSDKLLSQAVMLALVDKGLMRQSAYEMVQKAALSSQNKNFKDALKHVGIHEFLNDDELIDIFSSQRHIVHEHHLYERVHELLRDFSALS